MTRRLFVLLSGLMLALGAAPLPRQATAAVQDRWEYLLGAGRSQATATWDPIHQQVIVFGGKEPNGSHPPETMAFSPTTGRWTRLAGASTGPGPTPRIDHSAIYDALGHRIIVFGGLSPGGARLNDVWALSLAGEPAWTPLAPIGTAPSGRFLHAATYDATAHRMLVYGGRQFSGPFSSPLGELWALDLSDPPTWTPIDIGPFPLKLASTALAHDAARQRLILYGGEEVGAPTGIEAWAFSLVGPPQWFQLAGTGTPGPNPQPRREASVFIDPVDSNLVIFGGRTTVGHQSDVWKLTLSGTPAFTLIDAGTGPAPVIRPQVAVDPGGRRLFVNGGEGSVGNDVASFTLSGAATGAWSTFDFPAALRGRLLHTAIRDEVGNRMIVFGGLAPNAVAELWALDLAGPPVWSPITAAGPGPAARTGHVSIYDPATRSMIVFGGYTTNYANDVWRLDLATATWTQLAPAGTAPQPRTVATGVFDPFQRRLIVFGGYGVNAHLNDLWAMNLDGPPAWTPLAPSGPIPDARYLARAIVDAPRSRMLLVDGEIGGSSTSDVWALSLQGAMTWTQIASQGPFPPPRHGHLLVHDLERGRALLFGGIGESAGEPFDDTWALDLTTDVWAPLDPGVGTGPRARERLSGVYDAPRDRLVVFGGYGRGYADDVWALALADVVAASGAAPAGLRFHAPSPNPVSGAATMLAFDLPAPSAVEIDLFDAVGRGQGRVYAAASLPAGTHRVALDRSRLAPGIWFARLSASGGRTLAQKIVVLPSARAAR